MTPASRAMTLARALASAGIVAVEVTSPARPRSSARARVTASSISIGERKASGQSSDCNAASPFQIHHALDRAARLLGDRSLDHDLFLEIHEAVENFRQRNPLHVRTEIAGSHELNIGQLGLHVVGHRAFGHHDY